MIDTNDKINQTNITKDQYDKDGCMDLDTCYEQTVAELGLQQSKRDQIIAFYLTILGFVIPSVIEMEIGNVPKGVAFFAMYFIGVMLCHVILRYRIYKEVYWIACRVITQLCNIKQEHRDRNMIYTLFFSGLKKNMSSIVKKNKKNKNSVLKSFKRQLNSAETLLFETLLLFATFVGGIGAWYLMEASKVVAVFAIVLLVYLLIRLNYKYATRLMSLYRCVDTELVQDLESTFSKAWMLHCYVDDLLDLTEDSAE